MLLGPDIKFSAQRDLNIKTNLSKVWNYIFIEDMCLQNTNQSVKEEKNSIKPSDPDQIYF